MIYNSEERVGVHSIAKIFIEKFNWIFREQVVNDFGIDAIVETTTYSVTKLNDRVPTGRLIGIQIKSGESYFREFTNEDFIYRDSIKHLHYWQRHLIPIIIVLYDKRTNVAYWQEITESTILLTHKGFKIQIPRNNILDEMHHRFLEDIASFKTTDRDHLSQMMTSIAPIKLVMQASRFLYVEIGKLFNTEYGFASLLLSDREDNPIRIIYSYDEYVENDYSYSFYLHKNRSLRKSINDEIPWGDVFLNGMPFTDDLLREQMIKEYILDYPGPLEIGEMEGMDLPSLASHLYDSYSFTLTIKSNELAYHLYSIDKFLQKTKFV